MSNFKLLPIGEYKLTYNKQGKKMIRIKLDPKILSKVQEWDLDKIYIYEPKSEGNILGLVRQDGPEEPNLPNKEGDSLPLFPQK